MSLVAEQAAFLLDVCKLVNYATEQGFTVTGGELARSAEQQAIHVQSGRSRTMNSLHLRRCAIDLNFIKDGKLVYDKTVLAPLGRFWESLHKANSWGGNGISLVDTPHFSRSPSGTPEFRRVT